MAFTLEPNHFSHAVTRRTHSTHKRTGSNASTISTTSTSSTASSNFIPSLRQRRGVTFQLSSAQALVHIDAIQPKGHLEPHFSNLPRRRRPLPTAPLPTFDYDAVMGQAGTKSARGRDFGMGEDGWTVVL